MNDSVKISLTIELEGSTLLRKSEPETISYVVTKKDVEPNKEWRGKDGFEVVRRGSFKHYPLVSVPATQHINLCNEAYEYMISNECPSWSKPKAWSAANERMRLEAHLQKICEHVGGKSFTYEVLED